MIRIAIKSFVTGTIAVIRRAGGFTDAQSLRRVGGLLAWRIRNRTERGLDQDRRPFKPYSAAYAAKKGVSRRHVTLRLTGGMLRGFTVRRATSRSVTLGPTTGRARAIAHQAGAGHLPKRAWMGLSRDDRKFLKDEIRAIVHGRIRSARRRG